MSTFTGYPLKFKPIAKERIWGGQRLAPMFGLNTTAPIGEIWTLSDHPSDPSVCLNGPLQGLTLSEIMTRYPELYLGEAWSTQHSAQKRFPLLIKFLHAQDDLSVQIHPDDDYALQHEGDFGKTEAWYILDAEPGAKIVYGHTFKDKEDYDRAVKAKTVPQYLKYQSIQAGDFIFVPAKTLHALLKGTMIIEIQQSSDVTYRVYDWDRMDANGRERELHIDQAADVMTYGQQEVSPETLVIHKRTDVNHIQLAECPYFIIEKIELKPISGQSAVYALPSTKPDNPDIVVVIDGEGKLNTGEQVMSLGQGDTILIPSNIKEYELSGSLSLLRTYY